MYRSRFELQLTVDVVASLDLTAVSWCDGDLAQMAVVTEEDQMDLYEQLCIIANKQPAARSGTEQAADLCKIFQLLKKYGKITSTPEMTPLKRVLICAF